VLAAWFVIVWHPIIDSSSAVLAGLPQLSTVGIQQGVRSVGPCRSEHEINGGVAQW
jgi:hypothetical protein